MKISKVLLSDNHEYEISEPILLDSAKANKIGTSQIREKNTPTLQIQIV